jgi:hypothetical protein
VEEGMVFIPAEKQARHRERSKKVLNELRERVVLLEVLNKTNSCVRRTPCEQAIWLIRHELTLLECYKLMKAIQDRFAGEGGGA